MSDPLRDILARSPASSTRLMTTTGGLARMNAAAEMYAVSVRVRFPALAGLEPERRARVLHVAGSEAAILGARIYVSANGRPSRPAEDVNAATLEGARALFQADDSEPSIMFDAFAEELGEEAFSRLIEGLAAMALEHASADMPADEQTLACLFEDATHHVFAGIRNEVLLAYLQTDVALTVLSGRLREVAFTETILSRQPGLGAFESILATTLPPEIAGAINQGGLRGVAPDLQQAILDAFHLGARLARAKLGPAVHPAALSLDAEDLVKLWRDMSEAHERRTAAIRAVMSPEVVRLADREATGAGRSPLARERLGPADAVGELLEHIILRSALLEAALVTIGAEQVEMQEVIATANGRGGVIIPPSAHRWPADGMCRCGRSLADFLFCCGGATEIDSEEARRVTTAMARPCCGERFYGFRCDACGRLYAWLRTAPQQRTGAATAPSNGSPGAFRGCSEAECINIQISKVSLSCSTVSSSRGRSARAPSSPALRVDNNVPR